MFNHIKLKNKNYLSLNFKKFLASTDNIPINDQFFENNVEDFDSRLRKVFQFKI